MQTQNGLNGGSIGWLGFELSVLRRLKFRSVALPLAGEPNLGLYLKRWDARVAANDPAARTPFVNVAGVICSGEVAASGTDCVVANVSTTITTSALRSA